MLWASFIVFLVLLSGCALLLRSYWQTATQPEEGELMLSSGGTVLMRPARQVQWVDAPDGSAVREGDRLRTDGTAQTSIRFPDGASFILFGGTEVQVNKLAASLFAPRRAVVEVSLLQGRLQATVNRSDGVDQDVRIVLPLGVAVLQPGSYTLRVGADSQVRVNEGGADIYVGQRVFPLESGKRLELNQGGVVGPLQAPEELISNGDFSLGFVGWEVVQAKGFPEGGDVSGQYSLFTEDGRNVVQFSRLGSKNSHFDTQLVQRVNRDVSEFRELRLSLDLQLRYQSLSGGGYMGSEYPIRIRVDYQTADAEAFVVYGFFYQNASNNRTDHGVQAPKDQWVTYTAPLNLMTLVPRPIRILAVQISASGWDLESRVSNVSLAAQ